MKRVWKPLDINGLRLYQVIGTFHNHPEWNRFFIVAAKSPTHARKLIERFYLDHEWVEVPIFHGMALNVYQPASWFDDEQALDKENEG